MRPYPGRNRFLTKRESLRLEKLCMSLALHFEKHQNAQGLQAVRERAERGIPDSTERTLKQHGAVSKEAAFSLFTEWLDFDTIDEVL